jgi:hypothetical protein
MDDWKAIAEARGLGIPDTEVARLVPVMEALERSFRPLLKALPHEADLANNFRAETTESE